MQRYDDNGFWGGMGCLPDEPPIHGEERNTAILTHREASQRWKEEQMRVGAAFPSKYLKVADLNGKPVTATIKNVEIEDVGDDEKPVVYFREGGGKKGLVLNRVNAETITEVCGTDEMDDWPGHRIVLYPDKTSFQGKRVDCIRVREAAKAASAKQSRRQPEPAPADTSDDDDREPMLDGDDGDIPF